ncbi:transcriptional regulator, partial [Sulfolobus sp. A20-N-F6]
TELGKKALSIVNMIESQNVILPEEKRVLTPVLIEYADKVIIDKGMLTKIKEENKKLIIRNVNEVIFKDDIDENLLNGVLELIENVITIKSPPNLKDIISRKSKQVLSIEEELSSEEEINEEIGNIVSGVGGLVGKIVSRVLGSKDFSINIGSHLRVVYDGPLKVNDKLNIEVDGGVVKLSKGEPHLLAKCSYIGDLEINDNGISADGCYIKISYPDLNQLRVSVDGGKVEINEIKVNDLKIDMDGGLISLNVKCKDMVDITLDGGKVDGKVQFEDTTKARLNIDIDGGMGKIDVSIPKDFSVITSSRVDGGVARLPPNRAGNKGELIITANVDGGIVTINEI